MILDQPFPPDARVEREAMALAEAGFEVHLLCMADDSDRPYEETYRGIILHRVNPARVNWEVPFLGVRTRLPYCGILRNLQRALWNVDAEWHTLVEHFVSVWEIGVLHVHDLRLLNTGLVVAEKYKLPVVADLHENYPALMEMLKGKDDPERGHRQRLRWEAIERDGAYAADSVFVVVEEAKDRLIAKGVAPEKITVVPNTVDAEKFESASLDPQVIRQFKNRFLLTYVGHVNNRHRGIHTVLEALGLLRDEIPELHFVAAGPVREHYGAALDAIIQHYGISDRVTFTGWMDETKFVSYIEAADICLCPHLVTDHTESTFPNKVYLYSLFKKPILASACGPLQRYINDTQGGLVFESGNAHDLADKIRALYDDAEARRRMGENGRRAVLDRYNWRQDASRVVEAYCAMLGLPAPHTIQRV